MPILKSRSPKKSASSSAAPKWVGPQIDYPRENENVGVGHYAARISAEAGSEVQISIQKGTWQTCRYAVGHWWFDWNPDEVGGVWLKARARIGDGKWHSTPEVFCQVVRS
jgi:hypothetical protein